MGRKGPGRSKERKSRPRPLNRRDDTIKRWEKLSDIPMDDEDECMSCFGEFTAFSTHVSKRRPTPDYLNVTVVTGKQSNWWTRLELRHGRWFNATMRPQHIVESTVPLSRHSDPGSRMQPFTLHSEAILRGIAYYAKVYGFRNRLSCMLTVLRRTDMTV